MGLIGTLDTTPDASLVWDSSEVVSNNATKDSSVFDLGQSYLSNLDQRKGGELFCARFSFTTCSTATGDMVIVNVQGCNVADFSTGSPNLYNLGTLVVGAGAIIQTNIGVGNSNGRGRGDYVLPFYNIGLDGDALAASPTNTQQACRYVRIQTKTIGATSACEFSVRIQKL
jgi:hypothetical protein